jgi:nitroreductase
MMPYRPVERDKIQRMLEAARLSSFWGNVRALRAVVIERATAPQDVLDGIPAGSAINGFMFHQAPVLIVWWLDWALLKEQGTRLHELVDAGAIGVDREGSHRYLDETVIPFFQHAEDVNRQGGMTEMDCGQGIAYSILMAVEQGLGTCLLAVPAQKKLKRALRLPEDSKILVVQTVGYPAESANAGGQRPRLPFERLYSLHHCDEPFPRDEAVVEELKRDQMLQAPAPLPWRRDELAFIAHALNIPPIMMKEVEDVIKGMAAEAAEAQAEAPAEAPKK